MSVYESMTPEERTARARKAGFAKWSNPKNQDRTAATAVARQSFMSRFGSEAEKRAYFADLSRRRWGRKSA